MVREMAAVTIMRPWHLSVQQQFVHVCVCMCEYEDWCWNLTSTAPLISIQPF